MGYSNKKLKIHNPGKLMTFFHSLIQHFVLQISFHKSVASKLMPFFI